jgi:hypothetical protein
MMLRMSREGDTVTAPQETREWDSMTKGRNLEAEKD